MTTHSVRSSSLVALAIALSASWLISSCTTQSGAERRIAQNSAIYAKLSARDKELVAEGNIKEGMSKDAVFLAWGRPDMVREGSSNGRSSESWAYFGSTAVPVTSLSYANTYRGFYGRFGMHPRYGYSIGPGWSYGTGVDFVNYVAKTVKFSGNRVTSWERRRR